MQGPASTPVANCAFCGKYLEMGQINYTADARAACEMCNARVDLVHADARVGHGIRNSAIVSLVMAAFGFIFNPFLVFTIASMGAAIWALSAVNRKGDERFTRHLNDKGVIYALSIIALVIDALVIILTIIAVVAVAATSKGSLGY